MGTGIWAMHYIGMEAFNLPIPVLYDWPTVVVSLLAAIGASWIALSTVSKPTLGNIRLFAGGLLMGCGIGAMHYIGMEAMRLPAMCVYSPGLVLLSLLLAILISFVALKFAFKFREGRTSEGWRKIATAFLLGLAIPTMHYVGMAAAKFYPSSYEVDANAISVTKIGLVSITVVTSLLLSIVLLSSFADRRFALQERRLAESKSQLQAVFDTMTEAIVVVDCERGFVEHNRAACELLGIRSPTVSMQQLADTFEGFSTTGAPLRPEEWPLVRAIHGDFCRDVEVIIRRKETATDVTVEISTAPVATEDGSKKIVVSLRDITERKRAAAALKESELLYHSLFDSMDEGFCIIEMIFDPEGKPIDYRFIEVNAVFEKQTGLHAAIGKRMREFAPSHESYWFELYGRVALTGEPAHLVSEAKAINGFYEVHAYRIGEPNLRRVAVVFSEISERVRAEAALREQAALLDLARDAIMARGLDGTIRFWSHGAEEMYGYSRQQATGRVSHDLLNTVFPQQLAEIEAFILNAGRWDGELAHTTQNGTRIDVASQWILQRDKDGHANGVLEINNDISGRKRMDEARNRLVAIVESSDDAIIGKDAEGIITSWNPGAERMFGYTSAEMIGQSIRRLLPPDREHEEDEILSRIKSGETVEHIESIRKRKDGEVIHVSLTISPIKDTSGKVVGASKIARNISDRKQLESQLLQAQKMEAVGQLAAGVAHEINTPIQYVGDNTSFLKESWTNLACLLNAAKELRDQVTPGMVRQATLDEYDRCSKEADVEYLAKDIPRAIDQTLEGVGRVTRIVSAMKEFSHPGSQEKRAVDLNSAIETTITISRHEWKYVAEVKTQLDPNLPLVPCFVGEINQVLLNLVVNASHAIADSLPADGSRLGTITISTRQDGNFVEVSVADTGTGIPENVKARVFDPFFTTKEVGKGTGQGLTLAHSVVVKKHAGKIWFDSELGKGTTFFIQLPLSTNGEN
jgi:PAS domain S-box-containing protein